MFKLSVFLFLTLLAPLSFGGSPVHVVKLLSFSCPSCRAAESQDPFIEQTVQEKGGTFVYAPLPDDPDRYYRELAYFSFRSYYPKLEPSIRSAFYKGSQDMGQSFPTPAHITVWLQSQITDTSVNWEFMTEHMDTDDSRAALGRTLKVMSRSGAQNLPTYVFVRDGQVIGAIDPKSDGDRGFLGLRNRVIEKYNQLSSTANSTSQP